MRKHDKEGERLRKARLKHGWSLRETAKVCGVSHASVWKYERGEILKIEMIAKIRRGLGLSK
ncbi:MAG: hypothetical protein A2Y75_01550 [Candidatus Solincola sediminis]|uniref:HTH cro/C1-type domain-containing protein n=1 Tax=Candidatus Solincola sediminis TaxID=1797199 RepID=A0A1F2WNI9_9ACTN|nr:MAG: hypothetical protein A2Y75_01550 [Candidatus Solincola sediminis]